MSSNLGPRAARQTMRKPHKVNAVALASTAGLFYILALTPAGELWEQQPAVREVYLWVAMFMSALTVVLRRAESNGVRSLDRWMIGVWILVGFAVFGLAPLWPILLLGVLFGQIVRLEAQMAFQSFEELAQAAGIR